MNNFRPTPKASGNVERNRNFDNQLNVGGKFFLEIWDKHGNLRQRVEAKNGVTNVGKDSVLDVYFHAVTQITTWRIGLIDAAGFTALADTDTMASHAGWTEFTSYSEANRVDWPEDAAASQSITNSTPANFNITASGTLKGVFLVDDNTKGGTTGTLWSTALFAADIVVGNGDILKITYTVNADDC